MTAESPRLTCGGLDHAGHLAQQHGPLAVGLDHHVLDVFDALQPADAADQVLAGAAVQVAARGVGVAGRHRPLDLVERDAVAAQRVGIDQHLVLLAAAAHRNDLRDARNRQQPLPHDPIGQRANLHRRGFAAFAPHADNHDLAHDRGDRAHLRADSLGQPFGGQGEFFGHDLPVHVDVGAPGEFHLDHRQPDPRRTADRLHAGRPVEDRLQRKGDERFHFFRGKSRGLGHHGDARPVEVGEHVDGQVVQDVAPVDQHHHGDGNRQQPITQRETDDGVEHADCE